MNSEIFSVIKAKVIQASYSPESRKEVFTFELEYPRFIHSELMTHRMFSRNAMSSRAIPIGKMIEQVEFEPAGPCVFGKNKSGMQASENLEGEDLDLAIQIWRSAATQAAAVAKIMNTLKVHKQIANRLLEPFQMMKVVVTATEFNNFFALRCHEDAQPEIKLLAEKMRDVYISASPFVIFNDEYHVPYVHRSRDEAGGIVYSVECENDLVRVDADTAVKVSSSCCAQVSYRVLDSSVEKADFIYERLVDSKPVHASPFEHPCKAFKKASPTINVMFSPSTWEDGITHVDRYGDLWSGNLRGFVQHRQLIPDNVVRG